MSSRSTRKSRPPSKRDDGTLQTLAALVGLRREMVTVADLQPETHAGRASVNSMTSPAPSSSSCGSPTQAVSPSPSKRCSAEKSRSGTDGGGGRRDGLVSRATTGSVGYRHGGTAPARAARSGRTDRGPAARGARRCDDHDDDEAERDEQHTLPALRALSVCRAACRDERSRSTGSPVSRSAPQDAHSSRRRSLSTAGTRTAQRRHRGGATPTGAMMDVSPST
jgi:hypothetical protein